jgi:hypothetical protein
MSCSLIAYIPFEIYYYENLKKKILDIIVLLIFLPLTAILFKICSDVETISEKTKKLIEDHIINNDIRNYSTEYHITYQTFNTIFLSKPLNLSLLGLKTISFATIGFVILFIISNLQNFVNIKEFIETRIA